MRFNFTAIDRRALCVTLGLCTAAGAAASSPGLSIRTIADRTSPMPAGWGTLTYFADQPALTEGRVVFWGSGNGGQIGIYAVDFETGATTVIADSYTTVPGQSVTFQELYPSTPARGSKI